jgi:cytochrome P450
MSLLRSPHGGIAFDPTGSDFLADPYRALDALREATPVLHHEGLGRWFVTRHEDVRSCLRDRRLGRNFTHVGSYQEFRARPPDPRWQAFWDTERWSLLWLEPPESHEDPEACRGRVHPAFGRVAARALHRPRP